MADELNKKPLGNKPASEPAPKTGSVSQPKMAPKQNAKSLSGAKIQPGFPYKSESVPVGVQQGKFESPKHAEKRVNKMFGETNQSTLGVWNKNNTHPMAKPDQVKVNPKFNYKPTQEQLEAANRKKIMSQGFAPKNWDGKSDIEEPSNDNNKSVNADNIWNRYNQLDDNQKRDFALNVYNHGTNAHDNPLGKFRDPYTGEIIYGDAENNFEDKSDYLLANDEDSKGQLTNAVNDLIAGGLTEEQAENLFGEYKTEDLPRYDDEEKSLYGSSWKQGQPLSETELDVFNDIGDFYRNNGNVAKDSKLYSSLKEKYPGITDEDISNMVNAYELDNAGSKNNESQPAWNKENDPGSGVVTKELTDWVRNYLTKQVGEDYASTIAANLHKDHNMADFYKGLMKKQWEGGK